MKKTLACLMTATVLLCAAAAGAADQPAGDKPAGDEGKKPAPEAPKPEKSVTQHSLAIGGKTIFYTATAGTLIVRDDKDEPYASIGYVAYTQRDVPAARRPLTFAYNGGPGGSSVLLHMGALGPRRVVTADAGPTPPPYRVVDNAYSLLDKSDLVMIDPVGTGLSHAVGAAKDKDFWTVDTDIESVSRFIEQYVSANGRWSSAKYLLGESYGSTRSAGIVDYLQTRASMAFNGVVLVSVALDFDALIPWPANDRPYIYELPTFAAVAAYHHALPHQPAQLEPFLAEVRKFALGEYAAALLKGDALSDAERDAVAAKLHEYTGLSAEFVKQAQLRVRNSQFTQELFRDRHRITGQLDGRFTGSPFDLLSEDAEHDPALEYTSLPFAAAFLDYYHGDLKFGQGKTYRFLNYDANAAWDFKHKVPGGPPLPFVNTGPDLAHAMLVNPHLRVLVVNGLYDLTTSFLGTEAQIDHLGLEPSAHSRIQIKLYEAGHMMYLHEASLRQFKADVAAFVDATTAAQP
jgi:carboxypeptidase C (cathepsin A)